MKVLAALSKDENADPDILRALIESTHSKEKEKVTAVIGIEKNISDTFDANDLIKLIIPVLGGKGGGGRNTLAQGGGSSPENSEKAIKVLIEEIERMLAS